MLIDHVETIGDTGDDLSAYILQVKSYSSIKVETIGWM